MAGYCSPLPLAVIMELLEIPAADRPLVERGSAAMVALQWGGGDRDEQRRAADATVALHTYFRDLVDRRRHRPGRDVVSTIVTATVDEHGVLDADDATRQLTGLFTAGHETTATLIAHAVLGVLRTPNGWQRLGTEVGTVRRAVDEALRFDGPVIGMFREATDDIAVDGRRIPRGARVQLLFAAANRDPAVFATTRSGEHRGNSSGEHGSIGSAGTFDLDRRPPARHVAFGYGIHFCPGAGLAHLEASIALEVLARRLPDLGLVPGSTQTYQANATFRRPHVLRVVPRTTAGATRETQ